MKADMRRQNVDIANLTLRRPKHCILQLVINLIEHCLIDPAAIQDATVRPSLEVFSFSGRITMVRLLREASRLAQIGGASRWLDSMSQATGDILHRDGFVDREQAGLFYVFGKGRFAQVAARHVARATELPDYIREAVKWLRAE
jgi:hypothetical protein